MREADNDCEWLVDALREDVMSGVGDHENVSVPDFDSEESLVNVALGVDVFVLMPARYLSAPRTKKVDAG